MPRRLSRGLRLAAIAAAASLVAVHTADAQIRSDEFNTFTIDPTVWTFVNPVGDASLGANGASANITVPGGTSHDLWAGANLAPRLLQAAPNEDLEIEVRFESTVAAQYQMQGLIFVESFDRYLRLELHHDGLSTRLFAALVDGWNASVEHYSTVAGAPRYFRVKRAGSMWTLGYSEDGSAWTWAPSFSASLQLSAVGPFGANNAPSPSESPAFTAIVDHFRVIGAEPPPPPGDTVPPTITSVAVAPSGRSAVVTWQTDEPATSELQYGPTPDFGASASATELTTSHSLVVHGLECSTAYQFRVRSTDAAGNQAVGATASFQTSACTQALGSDEFDAQVLDTARWRLYDPTGDAYVGVADSQLHLAVPAGVPHDLWSGSMGAPRLLQPVGNADFEIEAKLDAPVTQRFQAHGLVAQQDADDLIRFDVHSDGDGTRLFVASFVDGWANVHAYFGIESGAPVYLRLARAGASWTARYSRDGTNWTTAASFLQAYGSVNEAGLFVGSTGSPPPGFSSEVDYFRVVEQPPTQNPPPPPPPTPPPGDTTPPAISSVAAAPSGRSATVTWQTDEPADSRVDYGTTSAFGASSASPALVAAHSLVLDDLACATTYHYRVASEDAAGNGAEANGTFTTLPCSEQLASDEFNVAQLDTALWRLYRPSGHGTAGTDGSRLVFSVPSGHSHDLWSGSLNAPRLLQRAANANMILEAKFDERPEERFQMQGLVVQADADDFIRFDVHSDGTSAYAFVATFTNGWPDVRTYVPIPDGAPIYVRLLRDGSSWTARVSSDGLNWTTVAQFSFGLSVTEAGLFVGSTGNPEPGFASAVDYFRVLAEEPPPPPDTTPPVLGAPTVRVGGLWADFSWTTNEPATTRIDFGTSAAYGTTVSSDAKVATHTLMLTGLACGTSYHFRLSGADAAGNEGVRPDATFTTRDCTGSGLESDEFDGSALDLERWYFLDPVGDTSITVADGRARMELPAGISHDLWTGALQAPRLLQSAPNDDFEVELKLDATLSSRFQLQGLVVQQDPNNLIRFEIHHNGTELALYAATFVNGEPTTRIFTPLPGGGAPVYLRVKRVANAWNLSYSFDGSTWTNGGRFTHTLTVTELGPFAGNAGFPPPGLTALVDYFRVLSVGPPPPDVTPPVLSTVAAEPSVHSAVVTWATDEPASSRVEYGLTAAYGSSDSAAPLVTGHQVALSGLVCETTYHFRVRSTDEAGNEAIGSDGTFTTGECPPPDTTPPVISGVQAQASTRSAHVTWATDEPATSVVEYGLDASYGQSAEHSNLTTSHGVTLTLACETTYHYRVKSADASGNVSTGEDRSLTTSTCPEPGAPEIDIWYGDNQVVGPGLAQEWANVLGHASDPDGFVAIRYSLNGGPFVSLIHAPDVNARIGQYGDFNIEIPVTDLLPGTNQITIVATDWWGLETTHAVTLTNAVGTPWSLPFTADWPEAERISDFAQVADGHWSLTPSGVRVVEPGYDRTIALGDMGWSSYEVTVPVTVHSLSSTSPHSGLGIAVGWRGHTGDARPRLDYPFGGMCFYYRDFWQETYYLWLVQFPTWPYLLTHANQTNFLQTGVTYNWKFRMKTLLGSQDASYQCKIWPAGSTEPSSWNVEAEIPARSGSVLLVADYADVTFGNVSVRPIAP